jgi:hypothetical protein
MRAGGQLPLDLAIQLMMITFFKQGAYKHACTASLQLNHD